MVTHGHGLGPPPVRFCVRLSIAYPPIPAPGDTTPVHPGRSLTGTEPEMPTSETMQAAPRRHRPGPGPGFRGACRPGRRRRRGRCGCSRKPWVLPLPENARVLVQRGPCPKPLVPGIATKTGVSVTTATGPESGRAGPPDPTSTLVAVFSAGDRSVFDRRKHSAVPASGRVPERGHPYVKTPPGWRFSRCRQRGDVEHLIGHSGYRGPPHPDG